MLKIGFIRAHCDIKNQIQKPNFEVDFSEYQSIDILEKAVLEGEIDAALLPLSHLPTENAEITIAAAVTRIEPNMAIFIKENGFNEQKILKLAENPVVAVSNIREAAQVKDYRSDIQIVFYKENSNENNEVTQLSTAQLRLYKINREINPAKHESKHESKCHYTYHQSVKLDATEFIPQPAEGVFVLICAKQKTAIAIKLRAFNDAKTVATSNVERRCLQIIAAKLGYEKTKNQLGVYCESDVNDNYHAWACWCETNGSNLRFAKISQSTRTGLADAIVKKLNVL